MDNRWTLRVEKLGRVKEAEVEAAPLTLFVGDNNSGKSYLMTILYTLLNLRFVGLGLDMCTVTQEYRDCREWIQSAFQKARKDDSVTMPLTPDVCGRFEKLLNLVLEKNLQRISRRAFNTDVPIGKLSVSFPRTDAGMLRVKHKTDEEGMPSVFLLQPKTDTGYSFSGFRVRGGRVFRGTVSFMLEYLIKRQFKERALYDAAFLPTSRTGFLLTYPSLTSASLRQSLDLDYEEEAFSVPMQLTRPCSDFLKNLAAISPEPRLRRGRNPYEEILQFMEERMVCGYIRVKNAGPMPAVSYRPDAAEQDIPMHLSSGVVTEITPLILTLRYTWPFGTLFIEEPEMSLHPALQQEMARTLIRIVNTGTPVFATTHSDTILSHLNNMVKLARQPDEVRRRKMRELDFQKDDLIAAEDVSMYQFDVDRRDGQTVIRRLHSDAYGFEIPSFNDALEKLLDDTRKTEPDDGDGGDGDGEDENGGLDEGGDGDDSRDRDGEDENGEDENGGDENGEDENGGLDEGGDGDDSRDGNGGGDGEKQENGGG